MTNIWANTFEDIRKPHFDIEDPYTLLQEKKEGKEVKKWWDDDGDGKGYEEGEVSGKFKKKKAKARKALGLGEASLSAKAARAGEDIGEPGKNFSKIEKSAAKRYGSKEAGKRVAGAVLAKMRANEETLYTSNASQQKLDVRKGIKNKINTKPTTAEQVEAWVAELVAEGYDLSEFTWEEMTDIYLNEAGTSAMAPRGDYQTTTATATQKQDPNAPLIAAKAKAAKAKVAKEISDLQVAKQSQRMNVDTNESVIFYLAHRPDAFTNLEEGVFNPKKSNRKVTR
ncbi:hypothetical protein EBR43_10085 [bacterium]|nr:hypothetical protein [bacterium]